MSAEQILTLVQGNVALAIGAFGAFFGFLAFLLAWRGLARAGRLRRDLEDLSKSIETLQAAERRMSLAIGKEASTKAAMAAQPAKPAPSPQPAPPPTPMPTPPRVDAFGPGSDKPNMFSTQQGISDLSRYRKKD